MESLRRLRRSNRCSPFWSIFSGDSSETKWQSYSSIGVWLRPGALILPCTVSGRVLKGSGQREIRSVRSGVPGLDLVLGGGIPEYSFNLVAGGPGSGKTTLAHQLVFANATVE